MAVQQATALAQLAPMAVQLARIAVQQTVALVQLAAMAGTTSLREGGHCGAIVVAMTLHMWQLSSALLRLNISELLAAAAREAGPATTSELLAAPTSLPAPALLRAATMLCAAST